MLRLSLCVVFISTVGAVNHDDTAKRRSEEILRAVAAAATADFEGLRQMQAQKVKTKDKIKATERTQLCLSDLSAALAAESEELAKKAHAAGENITEHHEPAIATGKHNLQLAIQTAIGQIYQETKNRYQELQKHAAEMQEVLTEEVNKRIAQTEKDNAPETMAAAIIEKVTNASGHFNMDSKLTEGLLKDELANLLLTDAHTDAMKKYDDKTEADGKKRDSDYIQLSNLFAAAGWGGDLYIGESALTHPNKYRDLKRGDTASAAQALLNDDNDLNINEGMFSEKTNREHHRANTGLQKAKDALHRKEQDNINNVKIALQNWQTSKTAEGAALTGKSAYTAARTHALTKFQVVDNSYTSLTTYLGKLNELDADETKKIADIQEEFESLAADWLQLAIYHCCDIVQGNQLECDDATNHLAAPLQKVFPGALKIPNVKTDCGRRLL